MAYYIKFLDRPPRVEWLDPCQLEHWQKAEGVLEIRPATNLEILFSEQEEELVYSCEAA